jgi:hypothetical protein
MVTQKNVYLSLCNLQNASAAVEAGIFKLKYLYRTATAPYSEKPYDIRFDL